MFTRTLSVMRVAFVSIVFGWGSISFASPKETINQFFSNYILIESAGWNEFVKEQEKLLAPDIVTVVKDLSGVHAYSKPSGYFQSLGDWSKSFATQSDFRYEYRGEVGSAFFVAIHGTLTFKPSGEKILDTQHCWNEIFSIGPDGRISHLEVHMNLKCI